MDTITKKWLERARYDLATAEAMLKAHRYLYVAFMCQQSLEKILKAIIINEGGEVLLTHNLTRLAEFGNVYNIMDEGVQDFLADLTPFAVEARYGDYKHSLSEIINKRTAEDYMKKTGEIFKWLRKQIKR